MATDTSKQKTRNPAVTYFIIFILGFLTGVGFTVYKTGGGSPNTLESSQQVSKEDEKIHQEMLALESEVTASPDNFQAWRRLGDLYYDHSQPDKAIAAYTKSLELHGGDANLVTDLGVMYRRGKQPEKAIEFFNKAIKMAPDHEPARFNKAIVYMYDLNNPEKAITSLEELLKINPEARAGNGELISNFVKNIKNQSAARK
ncbi:MAG: tetratricopeptide repeat protein [Deltaproteobacteria bacterium]|nr:tetratricopeptide repeat protein [Deltaproteobacteria bacterium]